MRWTLFSGNSQGETFPAQPYSLFVPNVVQWQIATLQANSSVHSYSQTTLAFERYEGKATCEVVLGKTRVFCVVTADIVPPFVDRPTEGFLIFNCSISPMAGAHYEVSI
jgi:hypothetical protein